MEEPESKKSISGVNVTRSTVFSNQSPSMTGRQSTMSVSNQELDNINRQA